VKRHVNGYPAMKDLCLVYLARARSGLAPFEKFLQSVRRFPPGVPHDFLIVFKGFSSHSEIARWLALAEDLAPQKLLMRDFGFDLRAYGLAAWKMQNPWFCFLNSYSEPLAENWLAKMFAVARGNGVGLVGATASLESMYSNALLERAAAPHPLSIVSALRFRLRIWLCSRLFLPFPNPHIRTNAFILSREVMRRIWPRLILFKRSAYLFENGRNCMTRRIEHLQLKALIVGKDGLGYEQNIWHKSRTFRQGTQENILVADNQTRLYDSVDPATRERLSKLAWGETCSLF
jgi:hypothetical protein